VARSSVGVSGGHGNSADHGYAENLPLVLPCQHIGIGVGKKRKLAVWVSWSEGQNVSSGSREGGGVPTACVFWVSTGDPRTSIRRPLPQGDGIDTDSL